MYRNFYSFIYLMCTISSLMVISHTQLTQYPPPPPHLSLSPPIPADTTFFPFSPHRILHRNENNAGKERFSHINGVAASDGGSGYQLFRLLPDGQLHPYYYYDDFLENIYTSNGEKLNNCRIVCMNNNDNDSNNSKIEPEAEEIDEHVMNKENAKINNTDKKKTVLSDKQQNNEDIKTKTKSF